MVSDERRASSDERFAASGHLAISSAGVSGYGGRGERRVKIQGLRSVRCSGCRPPRWGAMGNGESQHSEESSGQPATSTRGAAKDGHFTAKHSAHVTGLFLVPSLSLCV